MLLTSRTAPGDGVPLHRISALRNHRPCMVRLDLVSSIEDLQVKMAHVLKTAEDGGCDEISSHEGG